VPLVAQAAVYVAAAASGFLVTSAGEGVGFESLGCAPVGEVFVVVVVSVVPVVLSGCPPKSESSLLVVARLLVA